MKVNLLKLMLLFTVLFTMNSCSSDATEATADSTSSVIVENYTYTNNELETLKLINDYRVSVGLKPLEIINHISFKSEEHDFYMIDNKVVSHDGFSDRANNIMKVLGAKTVGENIAYNYNSPQTAVNAWLNSPAHKENIVGNYTHFGIAIREDATTGKKYYTNIFAKIN
ncbi:CAP domain-containing protein [Flavobacterium flavipallidum]|uniref:CAP domain-containing protein n=1 Tax=Flavobacterium flavipallidum TaxID=3139140 RepID=A0ABU9HMG0_9FLAO